MEQIIEKYSCYEFEVKKVAASKEYPAQGDFAYIYLIYGEGCKPYDDGIIESIEWFDTEQEARFAARGHIDLFENGEG